MITQERIDKIKEHLEQLGITPAEEKPYECILIYAMIPVSKNTNTLKVVLDTTPSGFEKIFLDGDFLHYIHRLYKTTEILMASGITDVIVEVSSVRLGSYTEKFTVTEGGEIVPMGYFDYIIPEMKLSEVK